MDMTHGILPTTTVHPEMTLGEALQACVDHSVPGLPVIDSDGTITQRFSIRYAFNHTCIPSDLIKGAHLLGHDLDHLEMSDQSALETLQRPIKDLLETCPPPIRSTTQILPALALMEELESSYLFVVDEGHYQGVITHLSLSKSILEQLKK